MQKTASYSPHLQHQTLEEKQKALMQQQQQQRKNNEWVETQARSGNNHVPVFFKDEPEQVQTFPAVHTANMPQEQAIAPDNETHTSENETDEQDITELDIAAEKNEPDTSSNLASIEKPLEHTNIITTSAAPSQKKPRRKKNNTQTQKNMSTNPFAVAPTHKNSSISLAQLTQGFLNRPHKSGNHRISMMGMKKGLPSEEQLRYERYLEKIEWCFINSTRINQDKIPVATPGIAVYFSFMLDRDGILKHLALSKSSGNILFDKFVLFAFQDASSSFPPVPQAIKDDPFSMNCVVYY